MATAAATPLGVRIARNRGRQRELYGAPLGDRVRALTATLGVTQARLARTLGISPAMLSQLVSARRVKIGDPAVLARLLLLDQRCAGAHGPLGPRAADALLAEAERARWQWAPAPGFPAPDPQLTAAQRPRSAPDRPATRAFAGHPRRPSGTAVDALRAVAAPARLAAAAIALGPSFPELAEVLRQAASRARAD